MDEIVIASAYPGRAVYVRTRLQELNTTAGNMILENAMLLIELKENGYYKEYGFSTFDEAIQHMQDTGQIDYGPRQSRNLMAIGRMILDLHLSADAIADLSVSKLKEIATVPGTDHQQRLLEAAKDMTVKEVQAEAKAIRHKAHGHDVDPLVTVNLRLTVTQQGFYQDCLTLARQVYSLNDDVPEAAVLEALMADWYTEAINAQLPQDATPASGGQ